MHLYKTQRTWPIGACDACMSCSIALHLRLTGLNCPSFFAFTPKFFGVVQLEWYVHLHAEARTLCRPPVLSVHDLTFLITHQPCRPRASQCATVHGQFSGPAAVTRFQCDRPCVTVLHGPFMAHVRQLISLVHALRRVLDAHNFGHASVELTIGGEAQRVLRTG